jgi:hypothetical protein
VPHPNARSVEVGAAKAAASSVTANRVPGRAQTDRRAASAGLRNPIRRQGKYGAIIPRCPEATAAVAFIFVYVVELDQTQHPDRGDRPWVYVGESTWPPNVRFAKHKANVQCGVSGSPRCCVRHGLIPPWYPRRR